MSKTLSTGELVKSKIYMIRGLKVMLDRDLAMLYVVDTKVFNQSVKRNRIRFPGDFMFQLNKQEFLDWRSQFVTSNADKMGLRYRPYAFTEQGVAMLSGILKSKIAIEINIRIMRAFVELRQVIASKPEYDLLKEKIRRIESRVEEVSMSHTIDAAVFEKKITTMSTELRRVSETLDRFQDGYIVIKRPEDGEGEG